MIYHPRKTGHFKSRPCERDQCHDSPTDSTGYMISQLDQSPTDDTAAGAEKAQVLSQAFRAAVRSLLLWSFVKLLALYVDEMQICIGFCMILMMNVGVSDVSCYGPADIETGILSRDLSRSHHQCQGRHCRFQKIFVVILRQFYIMVILNTRFCQPGFKSFTWTKKSRDPLRHRCAVCQRWGTIWVR